MPARFTWTDPAVDVDDTAVLDTPHNVCPKISQHSFPQTPVRVYFYRDHPLGIHRMKLAPSDLKVLSQTHVPGKVPPLFFHWVFQIEGKFLISSSNTCSFRMLLATQESSRMFAERDFNYDQLISVNGWYC